MKCTDNIPSGRPGREPEVVRVVDTDASSRIYDGDPAGGGQRIRYTEREWARMLAKEKAEKKRNRKLALCLSGLFLLTVALIFLVWHLIFRSHDTELLLPYDSTDSVLGIGTVLGDSDEADGLASSLCVTTGNTNTQTLTLSALSAGLFDLNNCETIYAKDAFLERTPASITKLMTALLTLKYGNLDDVVTVTSTALDIEEGSSVCDIKVGDVLSLRQLLYGMMVASGNDAAMMIAEHVGGSVDNFIAMMNEEALSLGATNTHYMNPHGLTEEGHYTSVYDIYLVFQELMNYDTFLDMINRKNYYAEYTNAEGEAVAVTWDSTNHYFTGDATPPDDITVFGGKTGTTDEAGACLALLAKDVYGNPYVAVILHSDSKDTLYAEMNGLLSLIRMTE